MAVVAYLLAFVVAGVSGFLLVRVRSLAGLVLWMPKALAGSAAAFVAALGALGAALGWRSRAPLAVAAGVLGAGLSVRYVVRVAARHDGLTRAFGPDWQERIPAEQRACMLKGRWAWRLPVKRGVRWARDVAFWTIAGTGRRLPCDLWQPPEGVPPSGLAFLYVHGGAWHWMDKDFGTRPFFRHLAGQGHVVMDVAPRLCPEVDVYGMVGDVKRAIVWMKANADRYGVDPGRVVVAGGSSGGHLALLAAYAPHRAELTPDDVGEADASVRAAVAFYPATDLRGLYEHFEVTFGGLVGGLEPGEGGPLVRVVGAFTDLVMGDIAREQEAPEFSLGWMMGNLLGGSPEEMPEAYALASPVTHAGPDSPPTLLLQGADDCFQPAALTRALHKRLVVAGVPSVYVEYPQTEHGFDLVLSRYGPAAQAAVYEVERFLGVVM